MVSILLKKNIYFDVSQTQKTEKEKNRKRNNISRSFLM